ncbi:MAG TPA: hypothetical protein VMC42_04625 [Methanoregulaceae archaeon]|nr:hypothetical protein [Methanoregulaceae archaeon]
MAAQTLEQAPDAAPGKLRGHTTPKKRLHPVHDNAVGTLKGP